MGSTESKFTDKVNEHNSKHEHDVCSCGKKLYGFCYLEYKESVDHGAKEIKYKVLKKQHCEICHTYCDPNLALWGGYCGDGIAKLSKMSANHCCKCKNVMPRGDDYCKGCGIM